MQFVRDGELFRVISITGPTHNLLGLMFGGQEGDEVDIDVMDIKPDETKQLDATEVKRQVCEGVDAANQAFGTRYLLKRIQFVPSDSPPAENYRTLAMKVVERLANDGNFTPVSH